jgi:hypothetical protein
MPGFVFGRYSEFTPVRTGERAQKRGRARRAAQSIVATRQFYDVPFARVASQYKQSVAAAKIPVNTLIIINIVVTLA